MCPGLFLTAVDRMRITSEVHIMAGALLNTAIKIRLHAIEGQVGGSMYLVSACLYVKNE